MRSTTTAGGIIKVESESFTGTNVEGVEEWSDGDDAVLKFEIAQILIWHGKKIHAIQTQYLRNGNLVLSPLHGSTADATNFSVVQIDIGGGEYIWEMSGCRSEEGYVTSLNIRTNVGSAYSFGESSTSSGGTGSERKSFKFEFGQRFGGQCCGFCGSANESGVTSIGICLRLVTHITDLNDRCYPAKRVKLTTSATTPATTTTTTATNNHIASNASPKTTNIHVWQGLQQQHSKLRQGLQQQHSEQQANQPLQLREGRLPSPVSR